MRETTCSVMHDTTRGVMHDTTRGVMHDTTRARTRYDLVHTTAIAQRDPRHHSLEIMKQWIKAALGRLCHHSGFYRRYWRDCAVVFFLHRIDDRYRTDPNTTGTRAFERFCDFLARYFTVVPLGEFVERLRTGADISGLVVITFDDGYADNHRVAAPILRARALPATFFVTTGFVDERHASWWDAERGIASEWMEWRDVCALHAEGFSIGAHTVTHADLGVVDGLTADFEVRESKRRLEEVLEAPVFDFCYPYGWPQHIAQDSRDAVQRAGFRCALEAGDRLVAAGEDPMRIGRIGVSEKLESPFALGFDIMRRARSSRQQQRSAAAK